MKKNEIQATNNFLNGLGYLQDKILINVLIKHIPSIRFHQSLWEILPKILGKFRQFVIACYRDSGYITKLDTVYRRYYFFSNLKIQSAKPGN